MRYSYLYIGLAMLILASYGIIHNDAFMAYVCGLVAGLQFGLFNGEVEMDKFIQKHVKVVTPFEKKKTDEKAGEVSGAGGEKKEAVATTTTSEGKTAVVPKVLTPNADESVKRVPKIKDVQKLLKELTDAANNSKRQ